MRSPASRPQTASLSSRGVSTELMPSRQTARRMKGITVVFSARPLRLLERTLAEVDVTAHEYAARADPLQILHLLRFAGYGNDLVATAVEHIDRETADTARRPCDNDGPVLGPLVVLLHPVDSERSGESGRTDLHRLGIADAFREWYARRGRYAGKFCVAAIDRFGKAAAIDDDSRPRTEPNRRLIRESSSLREARDTT